MKKILMVTSFYPPYYIGGADTHVYYLANALAKKGHKIKVLALYDSYFLIKKDLPKTEYKNHKNVEVVFIKSKLRKLFPVLNYIFGFPVFNNEIKKIFLEKYDVIHYHNISLFGPGIIRFGNARKLFTIHDHWFICQMNGLFKGCKKCNVKNSIRMDFNRFKNQILHCVPHLAIEKRPLQVWRFTNSLEKNLGYIDNFITPSNYMKKMMEESGLKNIEVIPNFISVSKIKPEERKYFLFVGRLERNKGILELVNTFKGIKEELWVIGSGELEKEILKAKSKNVKLLGWMSHVEISKRYAGAKAVIVPSISPENFPTVALEALSFGAPVIGSNMGGIPEIIGLIDKNLVFSDFSHLKRIILGFNPNKYTEKKIKSVAKNFSQKKYLEKYEALL